MQYKALNDWYTKANASQRQQLTKLLNVSQEYLSMISNGKKTIGPMVAMKIEAATKKLNKKYPDLPIVLQPTICHVCSNCPYTK
jgi:DNA-binding transcriptional regulator YdaS (Cro superfamily)